MSDSPQYHAPSDSAWNMMDEYLIIEDVKEKLSFVSQDLAKDLKEAKVRPQIVSQAQLIATLSLSSDPIPALQAAKRQHEIEVLRGRTLRCLGLGIAATLPESQALAFFRRRHPHSIPPAAAPPLRCLLPTFPFAPMRHMLGVGDLAPLVVLVLTGRDR